jgi:hypothetical protein
VPSVVKQKRLNIISLCISVPSVVKQKAVKHYLSVYLRALCG